LIINSMVIKKNIPTKSIQSGDKFGDFCDWGIVFSVCVLIFVLPVSIAYLDSFAALAVFFYLLKKINRIIIDWPSRTSNLSLLYKIHFVWKGFAPPVNFLNRPLQFFILAVFISVLLSQYPGLSAMAFVGKLLKCVFLYFSFIEAFSDQKRVHIFLNFFLLAAFVTALSGLVQHYTGRDFLKGHLIGTQDFVSTHRISSSFFGANGFGAYLLPIIAFVAHLLYSAVGRKKSWVLAVGVTFFLFLLLACLCWTYSRSSWVGYLVILFVMTWMDRRKIFYAGALLLIFILIFLPSLSNVRHEGLISDYKEGVQIERIQKEGIQKERIQKKASVLSVMEQGGSGRLGFWKKAISIIRSSPVYGTGLNTYTRIIKRNPDQKTWWYAHNCYLQMAAETGLLGLTCFLWMVFVLLRQGLNHCRHIKDSWPLTILQGAVAGLFGFLAQSFFDNTFYTVQLGVLMWLLFGLTVTVMRLNPPEPK